MKWISSTLAVALALLLAQAANAGGCDTGCCDPCGHKCLGSEGCCGNCGCHDCCRPMCKVICTTRDVKKTVYEVKCEWFCAPLPGCPKCDKCCDPGCGDKGCCDPGCGKDGCGNGCCDQCADHPGYNVAPCCQPARCRKILVKKEVVCKVPVYKCVPCYACEHCCSACSDITPAPAAGATMVTPAPAAQQAPVAPTPAPAKPLPTAPKAPTPKQAQDMAPLPSDYATGN